MVLFGVFYVVGGILCYCYLFGVFKGEIFCVLDGGGDMVGFWGEELEDVYGGCYRGIYKGILIRNKK